MKSMAATQLGLEEVNDSKLRRIREVVNVVEEDAARSKVWSQCVCIVLFTVKAPRGPAAFVSLIPWIEQAREKQRGASNAGWSGRARSALYIGRRGWDRAGHDRRNGRHYGHGHYDHEVFMAAYWGAQWVQSSYVKLLDASMGERAGSAQWRQLPRLKMILTGGPLLSRSERRESVIGWHMRRWIGG